MDRIGDQVGFGSPTAFRDRFKRIVGTSPQQYRRAFRAGQSLSWVRSISPSARSRQSRIEPVAELVGDQQGGVPGQHLRLRRRLAVVVVHAQRAGQQDQHHVRVDVGLPSAAARTQLCSTVRTSSPVRPSGC